MVASPVWAGHLEPVGAQQLPIFAGGDVSCAGGTSNCSVPTKLSLAGGLMTGVLGAVGIAGNGGTGFAYTIGADNVGADGAYIQLFGSTASNPSMLNLAGNVVAPTPATADSSTKVATTAFTKAVAAGLLPLSGGTVTGPLGVASTVQVYDGSVSTAVGSGINTLANGAILQFDSNTTAYASTLKSSNQSGFQRIDTRSGQPLFYWFGGANSSSLNQLFSIDPVNGVQVGSAVSPAPSANGLQVATAAMVQQHLSHVASMAAVAGWTNTAFPVEVDGTTAAGDGGQRKMTFDSANLCGAGGHPAADGGTCVNSTVVTTGSWNIDWGSVNQAASPCLFENAGSATDDTAAIQAAENTTKTVDLSCKATWTISKDISRTTSGQITRGAGRDRTFVYASNSTGFTNGLFYDTVPNEDRDYSVYVAQADTATKSSLIAWVPYYYKHNTPRFTMTHMGLYRCMTCVDMKGNSGGATFNDLQFSSLNIGIDIDGSIDTVRIIDPHWYPFYLTSNQTTLFYSQASNRPIGINSGRMDDLKIRGGLFLGGLAINTYPGTNTVAGSGGAGPTFGEFDGTDFDTFSGIVATGGNITCASCEFTLGNDPGSQAINLAGAARFHCSACQLGIGEKTTNPAIVVASNGVQLNGGAPGGPSMTWTGGEISYQGSFDQTAMQVGQASGQVYGTLQVTGTHVVYPTQSSSGRTTAVIASLGQGNLLAANNTADNWAAGAANFISLATDTLNNRVVGNSAPGWGFLLAGAVMPSSATKTSGGGFLPRKLSR